MNTNTQTKVEQLASNLRALSAERTITQTPTFSEVVVPEINLGLFARTNVAAMAKEVSHAMLAMRGASDRWNRDISVLPALLEESREWWVEHTRERVAACAQEAAKALDHKGMLRVWARMLDQLALEYNTFCKKQGMVLEGLRHPKGWHTWDRENGQGVELELNSFIVLTLKTPTSWTRKAFTKAELVDFMVGRGEYDTATRFNREDNKSLADRYPVRLHMAGLRDFFLDTEEGKAAWLSVYNSPFTKQRRKALMEQDWVLTNPPRRLCGVDSDAKNAWDKAAEAFPEGKRGAPRNGELHHLLGALNRQFDFGAALRERSLNRELEQMMAAQRALHTGMADGEHDWELGRDDFLGTQHPGAIELRTKYEDQELFHALVQEVLRKANLAFEPVHGELAFQWIVNEAEGTYTKVTDKNKARALSYAVWQAKNDARKAAEWEEHQTLTLDNIREAMERNYIDLPE